MRNTATPRPTPPFEHEHEYDDDLDALTGGAWLCHGSPHENLRNLSNLGIFPFFNLEP
jgi:hypothetical protein